MLGGRLRSGVAIPGMIRTGGPWLRPHRSGLSEYPRDATNGEPIQYARFEAQMHCLVNTLWRIFLATVGLLLLGALLWQSDQFHRFLVQTPWARELAEFVAEAVMDSHRDNLGRLGLVHGERWDPLLEEALTDSLWEGSLESQVSYSRISSGVEIGMVPIRHEHGTDFSLVVTKVDLAKADVRVLTNDSLAVKRDFAEAMAQNTGAIAAINAGFFDEKGARGLVLKNGKELRAPNGTHGYLLLWDEGAHIGPTRTREAKDAIQSFPLLLVNGEVNSDTAKNRGNIARRSAAALTSNGDLLLVATDAELVGLTISQLTVLLRGLGARNAIALDGGASSQLYVRNADYKVREWDPIPVALGVFPRSRTR